MALIRKKLNSYYRIFASMQRFQSYIQLNNLVPTFKKIGSNLNYPHPQKNLIIFAGRNGDFAWSWINQAVPKD
jgi:hypothetical protein